MIDYFKALFSRKKKMIPLVIEKTEFTTALEIINSHYLSIKDPEEAYEFLKFALYAVKTDLISSYRAKILYKEEFNNGIYFMPQRVMNNEPKIIEIPLDSTHIFTIPWKRRSLSRLAKKLKHEPFIEDTYNHQAFYYPYMDICHVHNGIHSSTLGKYYKNGVIHAKVYEMDEAFKRITTDGESWYDIKANEKITDVFDYRIAILFEISKMINGIK